MAQMELLPGLMDRIDKILGYHLPESSQDGAAGLGKLSGRLNSLLPGGPIYGTIEATGCQAAKGPKILNLACLRGMVLSRPFSVKLRKEPTR